VLKSSSFGFSWEQLAAMLMDAKSPEVLVAFAKSNPALVENKKSLFYHLNEQELSAAKCLQVLSSNWLKAAIQRLIQ
jgi:hypothetical protein